MPGADEFELHIDWDAVERREGREGLTATVITAVVAGMVATLAIGFVAMVISTLWEDN